MTTFDTQETSIGGSQPIELYKFTRDNGGGIVESWFYVNGETDILFKGDVYSAQPGIHRSTIAQSGEDSTMQLTVDLPLSACVTDGLRGELSTAPVLITVYRWQRGLADTESIVLFTGEVAAPLFSASLCTLTCTSEEAAWSNTLIRTYVQRTCPFMLYDSFCGASPDAVTFHVKVTAVSADFQTITVDELDNLTGIDHLAGGSTYYQAGYITMPGGGKHFISLQTGHDLLLQTPLPGVAVNDVYQATEGCDRSHVGCESHSNIARFGGFELIPVVNPWAGLL